MRSARLRGDIEAASIPGIVGVWCHEVGGSRLFNAISINQRYAGHARQVGHAAASVHTGAYLGRYTVVVDDDRVATEDRKHTSELQSPDHLVCRLLLEKKKPGS